MALVKYHARLIGFFDILGFSALLESRAVEDLHRNYSKLIDRANTKIFQGRSMTGSRESHFSNFAKSQFLFDSVVLVSHPTDDVKNVCKFMLATLTLMESAFEEGFFLRGCIALGDFWDDVDRDIFLSSQFPNLVRAEKNQDWCGCYLDESAETNVLDSIFGLPYLQSNSFLPKRYSPLLQFDVPLKEGRTSTKRWCLNWAAMIDRPFLQAKLSDLVSPKKQNSENFVRYMLSLPDDSQALSEEFRPAVSISYMKARGSMRVKFSDQNGCGVKPGSGWTITVYEL